MIIKNYELNKLNLKDNKYILLYGANEGAKEDQVNFILSKTKVKQVIKFDEKQILDDTETFLNEVNMDSLFDNEKIIIINRATDKLINIVELFINKKSTNIIIIKSGPLEKKSKLRNFFEKKKELICIPFYMDNLETLSKLSSNFFREKKINLSQSNINSLINKCNGDRGILKNELKKIELYSLNGKKLDNDSLNKLINLIENHSISELIDSCLAKNKKKTINILNENIYSKDDCILIARSFLNKSKKILKLASEFENNQNIELTISSAKPPIFWKDKEITKQHLYKWSPKKIKNLIYELNSIEIEIKKNLDHSINIIKDFILEKSSNHSSN